MQLFDNCGRRIPSPGLCGSIIAPGKRSPRLEQPHGIQERGRLHRLMSSFVGTGLSFMFTKDFERRSQAIFAQLAGHTALAEILNGVHLPICLPQLVVDDYGTVLNTIFAKAVERSFDSQFQGRQRFENCLSHCLPRNVSVVPEGRQQLLLERMRQGAVVGVYFPMALHGFSVKAAQRQMADLPSNFLLSGGLDTAAALAMYPDVLGSCSATQEYMKPMLVGGGLSLAYHAEAQLTFTNTLGTTAMEDIGDTCDASVDFAPGILVLEDIH